MLVATRCVSWSSPRALGQRVRQVSVIAVSPGNLRSAPGESAAGVLRGDQQGCAVLRSRPRECCQEADNEGGRPYEPALGPIRPAGPQRRRRVIGENQHRPVSFSRGHDAEHESLHKIPPKMQADREGQFTGQHIAGSEQHAEDDDVERAQLVAFSLVACDRPKKTAGITTAMTIPHRALATPSARFLMGYPR